MARVRFITGTDTGAGKTVLTALLAAFYRENGVRVAAFKPVCSGGRTDARRISDALGGTVPLDVINPWHFKAAIAPSLAAERENESVCLSDVITHLRTASRGFDGVLVEGAGGLLSPMGKDFDSRDLILALDAAPLVVALNKLGAVNHLLLTLEALPLKYRRRARVILMAPGKSDASSSGNAALLGKFFPADCISCLPWLGNDFTIAGALKRPVVRRALAPLMT